ncbi:hypothetical protein RB2150_07343 [Rhodobacterales bacterium HTCC2150]|nr:hypothetical protein RB2150_07343 [Rhodobacterales bacterium HTCC2150] [Rhodobacteraceae bacterium HTCC2150]
MLLFCIPTLGLAEEASPSRNATYALAIENLDGSAEKLITIGDHDACLKLIEQADSQHKLSCIPSAPVASQ